MTDVVSGVFSVICTALFLRFVWHPKTRFLLKSEREAGDGDGPAPRATPTEWKYRYTVGQTAYAWMPWAILIACCALWGMPACKTTLNNLFAGVTFNTTLLGSHVHGHALAAGLGHAGAAQPGAAHAARRASRTRSPRPRASPSTGSPPPARASSSPRSSPASCSGSRRRSGGRRSGRTLHRMKIPVLVIGQVLGLGFLTRYSGTDAVLGLAFTGAGRRVPVLRGVPRLARRLPDRLGHGLERALRQPAAHHGPAAPPERGPHRRDELDGRRHGQDDRRAVDHGRLRGLLRRSTTSGRTRSGRSSARSGGTRSPGAAVIGLIALLQAYVFPGVVPIPPLK